MKCLKFSLKTFLTRDVKEISLDYLEELETVLAQLTEQSPLTLKDLDSNPVNCYETMKMETRNAALKIKERCRANERAMKQRLQSSLFRK